MAAEMDVFEQQHGAQLALPLVEVFGDWHEPATDTPHAFFPAWSGSGMIWARGAGTSKHLCRGSARRLAVQEVAGAKRGCFKLRENGVPLADVRQQVQNMDEDEVAELARRRGHAMREEMLQAAQANGHSTVGEYVAACTLQVAQANGHSTAGEYTASCMLQAAQANGHSTAREHSRACRDAKARVLGYKNHSHRRREECSAQRLAKTGGAGGRSNGAYGITEAQAQTHASNRNDLRAMAIELGLPRDPSKRYVRELCEQAGLAPAAQRTKGQLLALLLDDAKNKCV